MRRSFTRCPSPSRVVVRCLRRPGRCRRGGPRGFLEVENGDEFDILRRRCCLHESSGARDRFSSHVRVSNRSASPRARRLSTCISRKTLGKNRRLSVNAPAGSEWRRWTPFKRPLAHVMSPTHSRHALPRRDGRSAPASIERRAAPRGPKRSNERRGIQSQKWNAIGGGSHSYDAVIEFEHLNHVKRDSPYPDSAHRNLNRTRTQSLQKRQFDFFKRRARSPLRRETVRKDSRQTICPETSACRR